MRLCDKCIHDKVCLLSKSRASCLLFDGYRPHGEWEFVQRGEYVDMVCPFCKDICIDGIAYGYSIDEVKESIENGTFSIHGKADLPNFCSNCGADMRKAGGNE